MLLEIRKLSKHYPGFTLSDISFSLNEGEIMGLIGKNGAGKSTALKSVLNMARPDGGSVCMFGMDYFEHEAACKQQLGVVLGGMDFYLHKKLAAVTAVTQRFYARWDEAAYRKYMKLFELDEKKRVDQLSAGMRVKYHIALALSHHARLLIFDEPTSGLDPVARDDLLELFKALVKSGERGILFSTHITSDLDKCADSVTYIKAGRLLLSARKAAFVEAFQNLKEPDGHALSLEEIMVRTEKRHYDAEFAL